MKPFPSIKRALHAALASLAALALASCSSQKVTTLFEAQSEGKSLLVQKRAKTSFSDLQFATLVTFDGKAPIVLDNAAIGHSLPYEDGVYGQAAFHRLDTKPQSYILGGRSTGKLRVVVYADPSVFSAEEFEALARALKAHGGAIAKAVEGDENLPNFQLAGVVHGRAGDFLERFAKSPKDFYEVRADGDVTRVLHDALGMKGMEQRSAGGLSNVEPGRMIRITNASEISLAALKSYKNPQGQSLAERFNIVFQPAAKPGADGRD